MLTGGERLFGGRFEVAYTPGHASHHVSYLHDGTAFVGDVGGVRITRDAPAIPPTPPPDIDVEAWHARCELIARLGAGAAGVDPLRLSEDVDGATRRGRTRGSTPGPRSRATHDFPEFNAVVRAEIAARRRTGDRGRIRPGGPASTRGTRAAPLLGKAGREARLSAGPASSARGGMLGAHVADRRTAPPRRAWQRNRWDLARGGPQRRPQHVRPRRRDARPVHPGGDPREGYRLADRIHHTGARSSGAAPARTPRTTGRAWTAPGLTMAPLEEG